MNWAIFYCKCIQQWKISQVLVSHETTLLGAWPEDHREIVRGDWREMMEFDIIVVVNIRSLYNNDFIAGWYVLVSKSRTESAKL